MSKVRGWALLVVAALAVLPLTGCSTYARRMVQRRSYTGREAGLDHRKDELVKMHCPFGAPTTDDDWAHGPTVAVYREGYVLQHSSRDKIALWVCEGVSREQLQGNAPRKDAFAPDDLLAKGKRAELADYRLTGYDRGHQAPAGDQTTDPELKRQTFYLSNMAPQKPQLNRQIWRELESLVRKLVEKHGHAYIITGGLFYDPDEEDEAKADGWIDYRTIGSNRVAVPTHFYKIVVWKEKQNNKDKWLATAFVLENRKYKKPYLPKIEAGRCPVDWVEANTGLNFMPDIKSTLPAPSAEDDLEKGVGPMLPK